MPTQHDLKHSDAAVTDPAFTESLGRGHEQRDTLIKPIVVFVIILVISVVAVQFAVFGLQKMMEHQDDLQDPQKVSTVAQSLVSQDMKNHVAPPEPRLQPSPFHASMDHDDWNALAARWDEQLNTVGKFADSDRVHIPVDRVIDMAAEKGLGSLRPAAASENK